MKFFTIITICRNNIVELKQTYKSVSKQTSSDYEWIVVDGDSSDGTKDWLKNIETSSWISEPDNGIYDAMNKGISMAKGKYIIFMNSGDCYANDEVLANSKTILEQNNFPAFVYGDSLDISEDGSSYYRKAKSYKENWKGMITQHQAMFFNLEKLGNLKYYEGYKLSGDYAFISSFMKDKDDTDFLYLNFPICKFSMGGLNESRRFEAIKEDYKIRKDIINLPLHTNSILYFLHFLHAVIKKTNPSMRFLKHKPTN